jgi:hypothetical protein
LLPESRKTIESPLVQGNLKVNSEPVASDGFIR